MQRSTSSRDDLQQQQPHQYAITLWDVAPDAHPTRLLPTDEHITIQHVVGDVVKADGRLHQWQAIAHRQPVHQTGGGDALDDRPTPPPLLNQVPQGQREDVMRVHEVPMGIHRAYAVAVSVGSQPQVGVVGLDVRPQGTQVAGNGLGVDAAKAGVHLAPDFVHPAPRASQHIGDALTARSVHRVGHHSQFTIRDYVQVHQPTKMLIVGPGRVEMADEPLAQRCLIFHHVRPASRFLVAHQVGLDAIRLSRQRRPTKGGLEFETVVTRRVVAGSDYHAGDSLLVDNGIGDGRCWGVGAGEVSDDVVAGQDAGHLGRVAVGEETGIEPDDHLGPVVAGLLQHVIGDGLGYQPQVGEGEGVGDDGTPAVSAKFNSHRVSPEIICSRSRAANLRGG